MSEIMTPKLSIIVPVYNGEQYITKCIDSILAQTYTNFELLIVDDGSTDCSKLIADEYAINDKRVVVLHKHNGGQSSARNYGLNMARGKYVAFADSDDYMSPEMYSTMINAAEQHQADIVICGHTKQNADGTLIPMNTVKNEMCYTCIEATELILRDKIIYSFAWDKIYLRTLFDEVRYPEGMIYEDIACTYKLFAKSHIVYHLPDSYYFYIMRSNSTCNKIGSSQQAYRDVCLFRAFAERYDFANNEHNIKISNST